MGATMNKAENSQEIKVVGIGEAKVDHLTVVDRLPLPESKMEIEQFSIQGGGTIANALATLAAFQVNVGFMGKIGDDDFGQFILRGLTGLGVDVTGVIRQPNRFSPFALILIERGTNRRSVLYSRGTVDALTPTELNLAVIRKASLLLLDGFQVQPQIKAAEEARRQNVRIVLDATKLKEGMGELMALSDILIVSERFVSEVAPRGEPEDALLEIRKMGPEVVVITMGKEGSVGLEGQKLVRQPALNVSEVDSTGAGDLYLGGFCYGLLQGAPLEKCMQMASATAGLSCRELGARAGLPNLADVQAIAWEEVTT